MKDLAPEIYRQRLVIEAHPNKRLNADVIIAYLQQLSDVLDMKTILEPVAHKSDQYGWAAWIHWETSGAHFYAWDQPRLFFSVDIYTCKPFVVDRAIEFTKTYFDLDSVEYREF